MPNNPPVWPFNDLPLHKIMKLPPSAWGLADPNPSKPKQPSRPKKPLIAKEAFWGDIQGAKGLGDKCWILEMPGDVLDRCFGIESELEMRDYVALAGSCGFFRHSLDDNFFQDLCKMYNKRGSRDGNRAKKRHEKLENGSVLRVPFSRDIEDWREGRLGANGEEKDVCEDTDDEDEEIPHNYSDKAAAMGNSEAGERNETAFQPLGPEESDEQQEDSLATDPAEPLHHSSSQGLDQSEPANKLDLVSAKAADPFKSLFPRRKRNHFDDITPEELEAFHQELDRDMARIDAISKERSKRQLWDGRDFRLILAMIPARKDGEKAIEKDENGLPPKEYLFVPEYSELLDGRKDETEDKGSKRGLEDDTSETGAHATSSKRTRLEVEGKEDNVSACFEASMHHSKDVKSATPSWPSLWRGKAAKELNSERISKTEAMKTYKVSEAQLISLKHVLLQNKSMPKAPIQSFLLAAVQALALRAHKGSSGHEALMKTKNDQAKARAEKRDAKVAKARADGTYVLPKGKWPSDVPRWAKHTVLDADTDMFQYGLVTVTYTGLSK